MGRKEELQQKHGIKIGEVYTIWESSEDKKTRKRTWTSRRIRIVDVYEHFALTESPTGVRECIQWWELKLKMEGPNVDQRRK